MRSASAARCSSGSGSVGGVGLEAELGRDGLQLALGLPARSRSCWAAHLAAGDGLAALLERRLDLALARGAGAQLAGEALAGLAVGGQLGVERLDLPGNALRRPPRAR